MPKDFTKKVILLKVETTEGTDAAPTTAANAIQVLNYQPTFMDADQKVRNIEKAFYGANPVALAAFKRGATFDMELAGAGTATGVPPWMVALRMAGFAAGVVNGTTDVSQSPTSTISSFTHWAYIDNLLTKVTGAKATASFTVADDEYPILSFDMLGVPDLGLASEATPANPTLTGYRTPVLSSSENSTFSLDGFALPLRSWTMSSNSDLQFRSLIGPADRVNYANRSWSGQIVGELPDLTAKNYFSNIRSGATMAATFVNGTVTGDIVQIACPKLQISGNVSLSEEQGKVMVTIPVTALPNAGNDEVVFTSK